MQYYVSLNFDRHPMTVPCVAQRCVPSVLVLATMTLATMTLAILTPRVSGQQGEVRNSANPTERIEKLQQFHRNAVQKTGLLIPLYIYPANVHTNNDFNRVIELKRQYSIDRLIGAGCVVLGYVSTSYGKIPTETVEKDMQSWQKFYPRTHGIFFDEMLYEDNEGAVAHQLSLKKSAGDLGFWPTVANPGTDTPGRFFETGVADVIVIHESNQWPTEEKLHGNYFGGYSDYPPFTRATLMYGQNELNAKDVHMVQKYARWIYVTNDTYKPGNAAHPNPWDQLSEQIEELCRILAK